MTMAESERKVFISHSSADTATAKAVAQALHAAGVHYFLDVQDISVGEDWLEAILKELEAASIYVLLVSPEYVKSNWGQVEIGVAVARAREKGVKVLPVLLEGARVPSALLGFQRLEGVRLTPSAIALAVKRLVEQEKE
jgi:hypothetical protein